MNNLSYDKWLFLSNPGGGDPSKLGTSNYNYVLQATRASDKSALGICRKRRLCSMSATLPELTAYKLLCIFKKLANPHVRKCLQYRAFIEDDGIAPAGSPSLDEIASAMKKNFLLEDRYDAYNEILGILSLNWLLTVRKDNVRLCMLPPEDGGNNDFRFYRFIMCEVLRHDYDKCLIRTKAFLETCSQNPADMLSAFAYSLSADEGSRADDILLELRGMGSLVYSSLDKDAFLSHAAKLLLELISRALGYDYCELIIRDGIERGALSALAPMLGNLTGPVLRAVISHGDSKSVASLLLSGWVYIDGDKVELLRGMRNLLTDIAADADGVALCKKIRNDDSMTELLALALRALSAAQKAALTAENVKFDPQLFELSPALVSLSASLSGEDRSRNAELLSKALLPVLVQGRGAKLVLDKNASARERMSCALLLIELHGRHRTLVHNILKPLSLFKSSGHLVADWHIAAAEAALELPDDAAISQALLSSEKALRELISHGEIVLTFRAAMIKLIAMAKNAAANAKVFPIAELAVSDFCPCAVLLDTYKRLLDSLTEPEEKEECLRIFSDGGKQLAELLSADNGLLYNLLKSDELGEKLLSGGVSDFGSLKAQADARIIPKKLSSDMEQVFRASPQILSPKLLDSSAFLRPFYMSALDSEQCIHKGYTATDIESAIFKKLMTGQRVMLTVNQLCDNKYVMDLIEQPWFLRLLRSGDIVISYYHIFSNLTDYAPYQMDRDFTWSSMLFLNSREKKEQAAHILRGKPFDISVFEKREHIDELFRFRERISVVDMNIPAGQTCFYYQRPGKVELDELLRQNLTQFYSNRTGPAFAGESFIHRIIDRDIQAELESIKNTGAEGKVKYNRSAYISRIERINALDLDGIALDSAEADKLKSLAHSQAMANVWDTVSDQYNFILGGLSTRFQEHRYHSDMLVPEREDGRFTYRDVMHVTETGPAIDGDALIEVIGELRAKLTERNQRAERLAASLNQSWSSAGLDFSIDELCGEFMLKHAAIKTTQNENLSIENSADGGEIYLQTGAISK